MISPYHLSVVMWAVVLTWAATAILVVAEFELRARRNARASLLLARVTADGRSAGPLPDLSRAEFQALVHAGLPSRVETALAERVRSHEGDVMLLALANGSKPGGVDDRIQALQVIASGRHPDAHEALAGALRAPQSEVAATALRLLKRLNDERAVQVLVGALSAGVYSPSRIAAAIDRMNVERAAHLGSLLSHESQTVRFWALLLIGRIGASQWSEDVRRLAADPSPQVRRAAVEVLGRFGNPVDQSLVLARLADPEPMVRVHAARAAASFASATAAQALARLLGDREWIVRAAARDSLCRMGDVATGAVTLALWEGDAFAANSAAEVLFLTGASSAYVARLLHDAENPQLRRLVEWLIDASGPQIARALYDQLDAAQQALLDRLLTGMTRVPSRRDR